jgi:hypothetical protein
MGLVSATIVGRGVWTEGQDMQVLGIIFLILLAVAVVGLLVTLVASIPDVRRYLAIRRM